MIYLSGDIHGRLEIDRLTDFFELESHVRKVTEEDYLIILGDVAVCWDGGLSDEFVVQKLNELPVTVLWIDGNHENFDLLDALPVTEWNGGKVQFIGKKIIHLMRGYVYDICGKKFFAFGGGYSIDKMYRIEGRSWWKREMPSVEEYFRGEVNLNLVDNKVDYVITHTVPSRLAYQLVDNVYPGEEQLQDYFQMLSQNVEFEKWYFGHWHMDCTINKYVGLYEEIVRLEVEDGK